MREEIISTAGRVKVGEVIIPPYPKMLHLTKFEQPMFAQKKIDGFNVRIAKGEKSWYAFLRGGLIDEKTNELIKENIGRELERFFRVYPTLVLVMEIIGKKTMANYKGDKDFDYFVFDIMNLKRPEKTRFLNSEIVSGICDTFKLKFIGNMGLFKDLKKLKEEMLKLPDYCEGVVLKSVDGNEIFKYKWEDDREYFKDRVKVKRKGIYKPRSEEVIVSHFFQGYCCDEETEILTIQGFKYFRDLTKNDKVAQLSQDNYLEFVNPIKIIKQFYSGEMIHIKARSVDLKITPNHKIYVKDHHSDYFKLKQVKDINMKRVAPIDMKLKCLWKGKEQKYFYLPEVKYKIKFPNKKAKIARELKINMDDWLEFFGYFISEGSVSSQSRVDIYQSKKTERAKILLNLRKLPLKFTENERTVIISNKQLWTYLHKFGTQEKRYIPYDLKQLSKKQLKILYDSLMLGDGHKCSNRKQETYYTTSKKLAGDIQEILLKLGYSSTLRTRKPKNSFYNGKKIEGKRIAYEINKRFAKFNVLIPSKHFKKEEYTGKVYCVETPSHIIFVRRNGRVIWCGNSEAELGLNKGFTDKEFKEYLKMLEKISSGTKQDIGKKSDRIVNWLMELISRKGKFNEKMIEKIRKEFKKKIGREVGKALKGIRK